MSDELLTKLRKIKNEKQLHLLPENLKKNVKVFGITGTLEPGSGSGDVKLFETVEEMNQDPNPIEDGLAIVYYNESANITANTEFQVGTFPETVVLPTAFTDYAELGFAPVEEGVWVDCWGRLDSNGYNIDMHGEIGNIRIRYESSDGITYTRTEFTKDGTSIEGNELDFGMLVKFGSRWGEATWYDAIGYFTQTGNVAFNGLYQYGDNSYSLAKTQFTSSSELVYNSLFYGKNGIENGSMQNVENLNINQMITKSLIYSDLSNLSLNENVTNLYAAFRTKSQLYSVPMINTTNVTNMVMMFGECNNLVNVPNFDTSNVIDMDYMFQYCYNLQSIPNFDTGNVMYMQGTFCNCSNLVNVPNFNTSKVITMYQTFYNCIKLTSMPNFDTRNVIYMANMFCNCYNLVNVPNFDTSNVIDMNGMFNCCNNLVSVPDFNTSKVTNMTSMFCYCPNLISVPNIDMSNALSTAAMFRSCDNLTTIHNMNLSSINEASNMFCNCINLVNIPMFTIKSPLGGYTMQNMFNHCNNISASSYANLANSLPVLMSPVPVSLLGLNIQKFTDEQCRILSNKGYSDATSRIINSSNVSSYWNIYYE